MPWSRGLNVQLAQRQFFCEVYLEVELFKRGERFRNKAKSAVVQKTASDDTASSIVAGVFLSKG